MSKDPTKNARAPTVVPTTEYSESEVLKYLVQNGTIDLDDVANEMKKSEIQKIVDEHPYEIAQTGKDKRWRTYIKLENGVLFIDLHLWQ